MSEVSFDVTAAERTSIKKIVRRAAKIARNAGAPIDQLSAQMDLAACHANGTPLDFDRLAAADDFNLAHDVFGVARHIDRETGHLTGFFLPRFRKREGAR